MQIRGILNITIFLFISFFSITTLFASKIVSLGGYYAPKNTIASISLGVNQEGTDYIYLSVSLTKDDIPIITSSNHLQDFTNVEKVFPDKKREDGNYYSVDFTMQEILQLKIINNNLLNNDNKIIYNNIFTILTLQEALDLIRGLNLSLSKNIGLYIFINSPYFHQTNGKDISKIVLNFLHRNDLNDDLDNFYLSLQDYNEIIRIKDILLFKGDIILSIPDYKAKSYIKDTNPNNDYESLLMGFNKENPSKYIKGIELKEDYLFIENSFNVALLYKNLLKYNLAVFIHTNGLNKDSKNLSKALNKYNNFNIITDNPQSFYFITNK